MMAASREPNHGHQDEEYIEAVHSLIGELDRAMLAISCNNLAELMDSIADQQTLTFRLISLQRQILGRNDVHPEITVLDRVSSKQLAVAQAELRSLNSVYGSVLKLSSHSASLMTSLLDSFKGHFQEASGPRLKYQTWSCQM
ncbi:MAG: hypothetical protein M3Y72_27445 [Acidobacteriota bacterium]|nr:hypothetical protein [Acidobacteriota bacterium]